MTDAEYEAYLKRFPSLAKILTQAPKPAPAEHKESQLERRFLQQLEQAGLTECCFREYYAINGRDFRLDFAFPSKKVGIEVQGAVHRIKGRHRADIEKRALHLLSGWRVLEVGGAEIKSGVAISWIKQLLSE